MNNRHIILPAFWLLFFAAGCVPDKKEKVLFELLNADRTGLHFANNVQPTDSFNMFRYMYFYNGAGVGAGDFNNDGLTDLFFASNQGSSKLFLNKGNLAFTDVSVAAGIPDDGGWSTGISVVDINNDGLLDIYVCRVSRFVGLKSGNLLLICKGIKNGIPFYSEEAGKWGLGFSGFSTQSAFFDYDLDGDLDMFLLNHSVHQNGSFAERRYFLGTHDEQSGDRMFRNEGDVFVDVSKASGIHSSGIGYGLGIAISDINLDGYPDLYIGNDFHENDYLYINQKDGTFKDELAASIPHTSQFSMGVDIADANNDAWPDIISMDMLPSDPYILKRSLGEDEYNTFHKKLEYGYHPQYARNALQWNRGNGRFSETAMYSGVEATDWSWAALWMDFDNDGWKDLFVSNGIPKRLNDMDYVNFIADQAVQEKIRNHALSSEDKEVIDDFPEIRLPNKFFRNTGQMRFEDMHHHIENDEAGFSNGAAYADFDNDGDLDIAVNNINGPAMLYENKCSETPGRISVRFVLTGSERNKNALGARVVICSNDSFRTYEKFPVKGFQSSMEGPVHVGLYQTDVDSILLIWPDNTYQSLSWKGGQKEIKAVYKTGLPRFEFERWLSGPDTSFSFSDITALTGLDYLHKENPFVEFDREPLIPHMVSREGPAIAVGDLNRDGLDDVFLGASKGGKAALFLQGADSRFQKLSIPALDNDSSFEDVDACWADVNGDRFPDLVVGSGGNEYGTQDRQLQPRVYLNDTKGSLVKKENAFNGIYLTASAVCPLDFNGDGYTDLFIGGRAVPWQYGETPSSFFLQNDGTGKFSDVTERIGPDVKKMGFVTNACLNDLDKDGDADLLISLHWDGLYALINEKGTFRKQTLTDLKGWWNFILPLDIDNDGDIDLIAGNTGLNNRLKPDHEHPVRLYFYDFDNNGRKEQLLTYYLAEKEIPFANKGELERQIPVLKKKFLFAEDFAKASLRDFFPAKMLREAEVWQADYFANAVFVNEGKLQFSLRELPWQAQLSSYRAAIPAQLNGDRLPDVLLFGNYYDNNIQMGRYDADYGTALINKGGGKFEVSGLPGLSVHGQVRRISAIRMRREEAIILARNNDSVMVIRKVPEK